MDAETGAVDHYVNGSFLNHKSRNGAAFVQGTRPLSGELAMQHNYDLYQAKKVADLSEVQKFEFDVA